ncbi:MAG: dioxygenase [Limnohabitans sp.]|jgi:catechol 1,2-dioxygenase/hydroxyquinol 1,2-dioxygenase|nr:6-chlorohydroxyquinol-1,2-dioxygenase [Burkholderiales bacterium]
MRNINTDNITQVVLSSFDRHPDARQRQLIQGLVEHLHAYVKEVKLTHPEWRAALAFLHRVGDISSDSRSEFSLLSDVTGISSLVDLLGSDPQATPGSVLGPFHTVGSPWFDNPAQLKGHNEGVTMVLRGRVVDLHGNPLSHATVDFWQNAANGMYWQMDPSQPSDNLRCQMKVDANGCFDIVTLQPVPYQIPTDGPVWHDLVHPSERSSWRPAHFHLIVSAPACKTLVTELFDEQDPYLQSDAVFGVREPLVGHCETLSDSATLRALRLSAPCLQIKFEICLAAA